MAQRFARFSLDQSGHDGYGILVGRVEVAARCVDSRGFGDLFLARTPAMQIPVLIEPIAGKGYQARASNPFDLIAAGETAQEACKNLEALIQNRLATGARLAMVNVAGPGN